MGSSPSCKACEVARNEWNNLPAYYCRVPKIPVRPGNPYDGHTLSAALARSHDRGCGRTRLCRRRLSPTRSRPSPHLCLWSALRRDSNDRARASATQRHRANDRPHDGRCRLDRNFLAGVRGDAINALLCGVGYNLRLILNRRGGLLRALLLELAGYNPLAAVS
jgi:transposase, IS5 family